MCNIGVAYSSLSEFSVAREFFAALNLPHAALFEYSAAAGALLQPPFAGTREFAYLAITVDIGDDAQVDMCAYLSAALVCFRLSGSAAADASAARRQALRHPRAKFAALTDDFGAWTELSALCGPIPNMFVLPTVPNDAPQLALWNSAHLFAVMIPRGRVDGDVALFLAAVLERSIPVFIPYAEGTFVDALAQVCSIAAGVRADPLADALRVPLETVCGDLSSAVYETFEDDTVKYTRYTAAIAAALAAKGGDAVVAVAGAGRGPLVECALRAGAVRVYAIEKNAYAFKYLEQRRATSWPDSVEVFLGRMEDVQLPGKVDILVSELLGGFGDNELAPECLIGCSRFMNEDAIWIPQRYTSYIVPVMSQHLWIKAIHEGVQQRMISVKIKPSVFLSAPNPVFNFIYPGTNELYSSQAISFNSLITGQCHGFGGWFEATLYGDITISSSPINGTEGMFSWWTVYFPLESPVQVNEGETLKAIFSRRCDEDGNHIWYEWSLINPTLTPIHNCGGSSFLLTYK